MTGKMMKPLAILLLGAALPGLAWAEDVYIRVEAKRGTDAALAAAADWQARVDTIPAVIFPLGATWTAIGFGPLPREEAEAQMAALKAARTIPADSLLTEAARVTATPLAGGSPDQTGAASVTPAPTEDDPAPETATNIGAGSTAGISAQPRPETAPPAPPAPEYHIVIASFATRDAADAALAEWRETLPETALWETPEGRFALAAGPLSEAAATQWLAALKNGKAIPDDSLISDDAGMGRLVTPGDAPDWPENPETLPEMPPMAEVQELLKWAGYYDGEIDGQSGPMTRAAIAAEIAAEREAADPALAMLKLAERRLAWRGEMGLETLEDDHTGLSLIAPAGMIAHERNERAMSIYGPKDDSGAALILFSAPGGQQEMEDMTGLITALGWVPAPRREISRGHAVLNGQNETHIGHAEARVSDGRAEGWVLIWPRADAINAPRLSAEIADSFERIRPPAAERDAATQTTAETAPPGND
ncbi:MAG: peptidoglycan-binding domain-containing protein [Paracoccus sp. (in: a-proteobacteria)]|nr:peptidoglycan-binding domain-containing protein [Paracoccus sp. (in: a-proteobacteria)]